MAKRNQNNAEERQIDPDPNDEPKVSYSLYAYTACVLDFVVLCCCWQSGAIGYYILLKAAAVVAPLAVLMASIVLAVLLVASAVIVEFIRRLPQIAMNKAFFLASLLVIFNLLTFEIM